MQKKESNKKSTYQDYPSNLQLDKVADKYNFEINRLLALGALNIQCADIP